MSAKYHSSPKTRSVRETSDPRASSVRPVRPPEARCVTSGRRQLLSPRSWSDRGSYLSQDHIGVTGSNRSHDAAGHCHRGAQITLAKEIREGHVVTVNTLGNLAIIAKRERGVWRRLPRFLLEGFEEVLRETREAARERFARLGLT